jgi:hypothetical protein
MCVHDLRPGGLGEARQGWAALCVFVGVGWPLHSIGFLAIR